MNKIFLLSLSALGLIAACSGNAKTSPNPPAASAVASKTSSIDGLPALYRDIAYPDFHYVAPHPSQFRVQLSDSITGYLVPDRSLPLVNLTLYFRESAQAQQPAEVASLQMLSGLYRRGGSLQLSASALDDTLEFLSAGLNGGLGDTRSTISLNCLSRDLPSVLALLKQVFLAPGMDSLRLELSKAAALQSLAHRFDQPAAQLSALSSHALYYSHPRLWDPTAAEIQSVKRADLLSRSPEFFQPRRVVFAVSGDFDRDSMSTTLKQLFASWKPVANKAIPAQQPLRFRENPGVFVSDKKITQANILMAQPFVKRPSPDYYPAMVASYILGGSGFTSRLTVRVRSDEGLAYSVYSFTDSDYDNVGTAGVALQTKVASVPFALGIIREEITKLAKTGPTVEELEGAKLALIESLPGMFDTPEATADAFARSELWGRSPEHFVEYPAKIRAVTADQVRAMIAKYFEPSRMRISIVGPADALQQRDSTHQISLSDFGKITLVPTDSLLFR